MATTQQKAAPQKKSEGFTGVRGAFWIIAVCGVVAFVLLQKNTQLTYGVLSLKVVSWFLLSTHCCSLCSLCQSNVGWL